MVHIELVQCSASAAFGAAESVPGVAAHLESLLVRSEQELLSGVGDIASAGAARPSSIGESRCIRCALIDVVAFTRQFPSPNSDES